VCLRKEHTMAIELKILALSTILLLFNIFAAGYFRTRQLGLTWNMGPRDEPLPSLDPIAGRLVRAQANLLETLPIAMIVLIGVVVAGRTGPMTALGGWLWLGARVVYLPLYWAGVPKIRTVVYMLSLVGLGLVLTPLLLG
jgi:uncharacterized MAPEG superfamily protein